MIRTLGLPFKSGCFIAVLFAMVRMGSAMPPHPDLLARIANNQQASPYYMQHESELRSLGVESPTRTRTISDLVRRSLDDNFPVLVILVDFSDHVSHVAGSSFDSLLFGDHTGTLKDFYTQVTYGNLTLITLNYPGAMAWQRAPQTYAYYVNNQNGFGSYPHNAQRMVEDVVNLVNPTVDFSQYDSDGDGYVEGLFILHSGPGAEYTGNNADIWSHAWSTYNAPHVDGVWVTNYSMEPEYWTSYGDMTCGVYAHEMGHAVFGLPDLYDTGYDSRGLGDWSLMAGGSWNGTLGNSPSHPDAWSRVHMGVVTPTVVSTNLIGASIPAIETTPTIYRLWTNGSAGNQYFLVENRQRTGYDAALPSSGLMIYHIDDSFSGNDNQWYPGQPNGSHYQVALEQADGLWQLEHNSGYGDAGDPYPGSTNNRSFSDSSTPDSKSYAQSSTNVAVSNISNSGATMTADLAVSVCITPVQVTGVVASNNRCGDVQVSWNDVSNETGYRVLRNSSQIGSDVPSNVISFTDSSAVAGTLYSYSVLAFNGTCVGPVSSPVTGVRATTPVQVTGVSASRDRCDDIQITWTDVSGESGYRVMRNGIQIGSDLAANATNYLDATAAPELHYAYSVLAFNGPCTSTLSLPDSGMLMAAPGAVSNVAATQNRCDSVIVTWEPAAGATRYRLFRGTNDRGTISGTRYPDAPQAGTYSYTVRSENECANGPTSDPEDGTLVEGPGNTNDIQASDSVCGRIEITWTAAWGSVTRYIIMRDTVTAGTVPFGTNSFIDSVTGGYWYSVIPHNDLCGDGYSGAPDSGFAAPIPATVTGVAASDSLCNGIMITWISAEGAIRYEIFRDSDSLSSVPSGTLSYMDSVAVRDVKHIYRVQAFYPCGGATQSAPDSGRVLEIPALVTGIQATDNRCDSIIVSWNACTGGDSLRILRDGANLITLPVSTIRYADTPPEGSYFYSVLAANQCGTSPMASDSGSRCSLSAGATVVVPTVFSLEQNFPNPFNPATEIRFGIPQNSDVSIVIFDLMGRTMSTILSGRVPAGYHSVIWACPSCPSGTYLLRMQTPDRVLTRKMLLIK